MRTRVVTGIAGMALAGVWFVAAPQAEAGSAPRRSSGKFEPIKVVAARSGVSQPARRLAARQQRVADSGALVEVENRLMLRSEAALAAARSAKIPDLLRFDPVLQTAAPQLSTPNPLFTFDGIDNFDNANAFGFRVLPPDTNGDVGPNHYVQTVNLLVRVFDKAGNPLTPPFKMSSLFAPLGGICATTDSGDPIVLYDPLADRWLLSQFGLPAGLVPPFHQCIAVSQTADPTGAWFVYDFVMPGAKLNDYPHFGVWPDAYYMTDNQFLAPAFFFAGGGVFAFERSKMLAGDPTASFIYFDLELLDPSIGGMLPADLDGAAPPAGTPDYFVYFTALNFGDPQDGLRIFEFRPDFAVPGNSTFTERPESPVAVAAFDPTFNSTSGPCPGSGTGFNSRDDFDQPPLPGNPAASCNARLDAIGDRVLHRLQYRNFGGHESLVVNHSVDVNFTPPTSATGYQGGVRYYELRRPLPGGNFFVNEQATFAPDTDNRWMGSAAMDGCGNLAVGYSVTSASTFPSVRYAGRLASDAPNGLFQGEASLFPGAGSQANSGSRWGDYSGLSVDPSDECSFWYTTEYYKPTDAVGGILCSPTGFFSNACWSTRIGTFRFPTCIANPAVSPTTLWPPNHKLVDVTVSYTAGAGASCSLSVASNEPVTGAGTGNFAPDWIVVDAHHVQLRAERSGQGEGRVYTITITCSDAGGSNTKEVSVTVPHDQD